MTYCTALCSYLQVLAPCSKHDNGGLLQKSIGDISGTNRHTSNIQTHVCTSWRTSKDTLRLSKRLRNGKEVLGGRMASRSRAASYHVSKECLFEGNKSTCGMAARDNKLCRTHSQHMKCDQLMYKCISNTYQRINLHKLPFYTPLKSV